MARKIRVWLLGGIVVIISLGGYRMFSTDKVTIYPNRPLIWRDFKQVPLINGKESINAKCISTTDFEIDRIVDEGEHKRIALKVAISLQEEQTQVALHFLARADKATKEQVLHHENGHFKIAQITGRKIVQTVDKFLFRKTDYQSQLDSIVRSHYKAWSQMDWEYDYATTNPRDIEKQKDWDLLFKQELGDLNAK